MKRPAVRTTGYQITRTGYCAINGSGVTITRPPAIA